MSGQEEDHFFDRLFLCAGVALIATDDQFRIRFWNDAASRLFGGSAATMLNEPIMSIVPGERRNVATRLFERAIHRGEVSEFEFSYGTSGQPLYLAVTISPIIDRQGRHVGVSVFARDVSRRMEAERDLADERKMVALGSMAGAVAHHFNNVIGGIITSVDFAQSSDNPQTLRRALSTTISALTRANRLTLSLLAFAEGDRTECLTHDLNETVRQFVASLEPKLKDQNIKLETSLQPLQAMVPAKRILSILDGLTTNACEAMPEGGTLRIELAQERQQILLRVIDTGQGIPAEDLPRVFEPFFTTKFNDAVAGGHVGLGLAVVHGIVKELGGTVTLCSERPGGTICTVWLPAVIESI